MSRHPYFKEGLSLSVYRGCPGTHTYNEGLSRSVHCGCPGTRTLKRDYPVLYIVGAQAPILLKRDSSILHIVGSHNYTHIFEEKRMSSFSLSGTIFDSIHAKALFFDWSIGPLQR